MIEFAPPRQLNRYVAYLFNETNRLCHCWLSVCLHLSVWRCANVQTSETHPCQNPFIDRELSGRVTLASEWLELKPTEPLKVARDKQELTLFPNPPIQMVFARGTSDLIPADGRSADIEAELIGSDGITYHSRPGLSETMTGNLKVMTRSLGFKDLPDNVTYTKVRIKSSAPYPVSKIIWRCYNWGEVNH